MNSVWSQLAYTIQRSFQNLWDGSKLVASHLKTWVRNNPRTAARLTGSLLVAVYAGDWLALVGLGTEIIGLVL